MISSMPEGTSQPCPSCGISVMIGYQKCPKCHAPMPGAAAQRTRRGSMAGGTTSEKIDVVPEGGGSGATLWVVALLAIAGGTAIWATQCRGGKARPTPAAITTEPVDQPAGRGTAPSVPDEGPDQVAPSGPDPAFAADALEGELGGERLYATVAAIGEVLDVRSAFCAEARLGEIIARHAAELKAAGVLRVRCSETYGTQVFEREL